MAFRDRPPFRYNRPPPEKPITVDREKTCPFLLRVFWKGGEHHRIEEFEMKGKEPKDSEIQIYTWKDCTLRELTGLIQQVVPIANRRDAKLSFMAIYHDNYRGRPRSRMLGSVFAKRSGKDDNRTLHELRVEIGDFIDVSIDTQ